MIAFERTGGTDDPVGPRTGSLTTARGVIRTPAFMPVGTLATVKTVSTDEVRNTGADILLVNAYHLYLRPGHELIERLGGVHRFMDWSGPILSDSGGFQVFSLAGLRKVSEDGVKFRSHIDGSEHFYTPELAMAVQSALGVDIAMPLDHVLPGESDHRAAQDAVERTLRWYERCRSAQPELATFAIVQGGIHEDLRRLHAREAAKIGAPGYSIGGLSVGESLFKFHDERGTEQTFICAVCKGKLKKTAPISTDEFKFLKSVAKGEPKITMPSPSTFHFWRGDRGLQGSPYKNAAAFFDDLCAIYRQEIADLAALGCRYVQLDEVAIIMLGDPEIRAKVKARGEDPDALMALYIKAMNDAVKGRPKGVTAAMHICRGNFKGKWLSEGGYDSIAERVFKEVDVDAFCLEYDTPRAGSFTPLRLVPKGKTIVLGLVSSKLPVLEHKDELRARILPRMARGEAIGAFALTEPSAGSDAAGIQTRAEPGEGGSYVLSGSKSWVTNGDVAGVYTVFARTSPPEEDAKPKITGFVVERSDAIVPGASEGKLGMRGAWTGDVKLVKAVAPAGNVLGEVGKGFKVAMELLTRGRVVLAASCLGACKRLVKHAVDRCKSRKAFARPIGEFGLIKDKVAMMMSETFALESAVYLTTGMLDRGATDFSVESAICKVLGSEVLLRVAHEALQIAGAQGYMSAHAYERVLRDARVYPIYQGTNEILRCFIALSGMQGPGREITEVSKALREPVKGFGLLSDFALRKARSALGRERFTRAHPVLAREAVLVEEYSQDLSRSVDKVMRKHGHNIAEMQYTQRRVADMVIDLYAASAAIARTTQAIQKKGEEGSRREIDLTMIYVAAAEKRLAEHVRSFDKNDDELRKAVASRAYVDGAYPLDVLGH